MKLLCIHTEGGQMAMGSPIPGDMGQSILADFKKHIQKKWPDLYVHWLDADRDELLKLLKQAKSVKDIKMTDICKEVINE